MKTLINRFSIVLAIILVLSSCKKDPTTNPTNPTGCTDCNLNELIDNVGSPEPVMEVLDSTETNHEIDFSSNWECTDFEVDITQARGEYRTFDPNSEIIWPGNLLQGNSITAATPNPIVVERAEGEFTINLINGSSSTTTSAEVTEVDQTRVVGALNDILGQNNGLIPANFTYDFYEVQSQQQLALNMGVNVSTMTTDVKSKMSFSTDKEYNRVLVDFSQIYYSMIYEKPTSLDQVFAPEVTNAELSEYIYNGNPPIYISSVTYGRRLYLLVESTSSLTEMNLAIEATYDAALASGSGDVDVNMVNDLSERKIKIFAMGGDASDALAAFQGDFSALKDYLQADDQDYLKAAPLSYVMRDLANHQVVNIGVSTNFTVNQCTPLYDIAPPTFVHGWYGVFNNEGIGAALALDQDQNNAILFNQAGDKYVLSQNGVVGQEYSLSSSDGPLAGCPLERVSAAQVQGEAYYLFDETGEQFCIQHSSGAWSTIHSLFIWGVDGSHPFLNPPVGEAGVGSSLYYTNGRSIHFDSRGQRWVVYNPANGGSFGTSTGLEDWGGNQGPEFNIPFLGDGVGPALQLKVDMDFYNNAGAPPSGEDWAQILFSKDGKSFSIYHGHPSRGFTPTYRITE